MENIRQIDEKIKKITHLTKDWCTTQKLTWIECTFPEMRVVGAWSNILETAYKTATIGLDTYLDTKNDPLLVIA